MQAISRHILCVDDNEDIRFILSAFLGRAGYQVRTASGVVEGLRLAESERFDLYVLDNRFADGAGLDLCHRIREFDSATPILFFSGLAYDSDRRCGLDAGAQDYLVKPNDLDKLTETVTLLIGNNASKADSSSVSAVAVHSQLR